jgi:hypothetical protein
MPKTILPDRIAKGAYLLRREVKPEIRGVLIVLSYAKVSAGNRQRTVIVYFHDNGGGDTSLPRVIAKGFPQGVARNPVSKPQRFPGCANQPVCLYATYGFARPLV